MMNFYYKIWVDVISRMKAQSQNKDNWKLYSFIFMSMAMSLNLLLFMTVLQSHVLKIPFYNFKLDFFPGEKLDASLKYIILFFLPVAILNYFLIFFKKKYKRLLKSYKTYNGKLAVTYLLLSYFMPFILLFIAYIINKI